MKSIPIPKLVRDRYFSITIGLSFLILILSASLFYVQISPLEKPLILHFDSYMGIDFLGSKAQVFQIILSVFILFIINLFLAAFLYNRERFLSYMFVFVSLEIAVLILMAIGVIISVNK